MAESNAKFHRILIFTYIIVTLVSSSVVVRIRLTGIRVVYAVVYVVLYAILVDVRV